MQCQPQLEPWDEAFGGIMVVGEARCPRRAVAAIEKKWVCRQHLAATLRRLRGEVDPRATWWEVQTAEAQGRCYYCGSVLRRLDKPRQAATGTLAFYDVCPNETCAQQRSAAYQAAVEAEAFMTD